MKKWLLVILFAVGAGILMPARAEVLFNDDFDTDGLADFTFVDLAGSNAGKTGLVTGVSGFAGHIGDTINYGSNSQPGAYLMPTGIIVDPASNFTVTVDFKFEHEASYDDAVFVLGDLAGGNYYATYTSEDAGGNDVWIAVNGIRKKTAGQETVSNWGAGFADDTWYSATYSWTAATETLLMSVAPLAGGSSQGYAEVLDSSTTFNISLTNFTDGVQFGFGTHNDRASFDNVVITGTAVEPPPPPPPPPLDAVFSDDFESGVLTNFTQVDMAGGAGFSVSTDGADGTYSGQVGGNVGTAGGTQPGAWLQAKDLYLSATNDFSVAYDTKFMHEGTWDDCVLVFGDLNRRNYYASYMNESLAANEVWYYSGGSRISSNTVGAYAGTAFADDTWYSATYTWTAESQTLSFNATILSNTTSFASWSMVMNGSGAANTSLTNCPDGVQIGFGTHNDGARFDNIVISGTKLPVPVPDPIPECAVEIAPDGVWTWFNDERAIWHQGYLFSGYVKKNGEYGISRFDPDTGTSDHMVISTSASRQTDDHNNPSITVLPDDTLLIAYSKHINGNVDQFFYRTSKVVAPAADADWNDEQTQVLGDSGTKNAYNNTYRLTGEDNKIYNFHRYINFNPTITVSTNNAVSWEAPVHFINAGTDSQRPYPRYCSDHTNRIDLIYTDGHPDKNANSIYHLYYRTNAFHKTDGTLAGAWADLPLSVGDGTIVYPYTATAWGAGEGPDDWIPAGRGWTWDICYQDNGDPVCVFQVSKRDVMGASGFEDDRIYYYYARWTGSEWQRRFIGQGGCPIYDTQREYGGGMALDPDEPNVVYVSSNAENPFDLSSVTNVPLNSSERYEIYRGVTEDGGLTFHWEAVTTNSLKDNLRPIVPENHGLHRHLLWFYGTYTTFFSFDCQVLAILDEGTVSLADWRSEYGVTNGLVIVDSDGDGLTDLAEYALGGNPTNAMDTPAPVLIDGKYRFHYLRERPDVSSVVEVSTNLSDVADWREVARYEYGTEPVNDPDFPVEFTAGEPAVLTVPLNPETNGPALFMRLRVEALEY